MHGGLRAPDSGWTDDEVETLRQMWRSREKSMTEIGRALGKTKCAISGKIGRLGLLRRSAEEISAAKRQGQLLAAEAKKAKSEAQRQRVAERSRIEAEREAKAAASKPIANPFVVLQKRGAAFRQPPQLSLVSSVELPIARPEPSGDLYSHMRMDRNYHDALAALSRREAGRDL